jgi:DNA end-binding protein Ku
MAGDFNPDQYTDTYQEQLQILVESKLSGGQAFATAEAPARIDDSDDVSDLLAKLEASVRRRREQSAAGSSDNPTAAAVRKAPVKKAPTKKAAAKKSPARKAPVKK